MPLPDWKKVLVVDLGFLGDTVHSVPAIRALAVSGMQVDVMTTPVGAEVLGMVPEIRRVWVTPLRKPSPPWWQGLAQIFALRSEKYDAALSFSGADRNLFGVAFSGAKERVAVASRRRWWQSALPLTRRLVSPQRNQPLFRQRLAVLQQLGWSGSSPGWAWEFSPQAEKEAAATIPPRTVYLATSAFGSPHKEWPLESWAETARLVWQARPETKFLLGYAPGARERERAQRLASLAGNLRQLYPLDSSPTLAGLASILNHVELFAGLDSGVLHLAVALGKPTVSVFRDYSGKAEWAPGGAGHRVISRPCQCHQTQTDSCGTTPRCLAGVSPQDVAAAILELLPA